MRELVIDQNSSGQRIDRFLGKYMPKAPSSFFYKMMRKKNITLNGKKCEGPERLKEGDAVQMFLADETIDHFRETRRTVDEAAKASSGSRVKLDIIYEDSDILLVNKPAGMLSQKAAPGDVSLNEYMISYLLDSRKLTGKDLEVFRPSVCNRLDRNTSGIVICGKTLRGLREMSGLLQSRDLEKKYLCLVNGVLRGEQKIEGYLKKDERTNHVTVSSVPDRESVPIATVYRSILDNGRMTLLEVELITGKSHQIRAHLSSVGHEVVGDVKYGSEGINREFFLRYGVRAQLLHAYKLSFPEMKNGFERLSGRQFTAKIPPVMKRVLTGEGLWLPGILEG